LLQKKGLRQGDPLSPILFNVVADMLAVLIKRAKQNGQIQGVVPHLVDDGLSILQYADDTIIFMEDDLETFEQLSGLKINFHKSDFFCFGEAQNSKNLYSHLFRCQVGKYPFKYLGIPMHYKRIKNVDWKELEQHMEKSLVVGKKNCSRLVAD
jgi:hypothetical protein